jgi:hypothetical protein
MRAAWDVVGDDTLIDIAIRFEPSVAMRVSETRWHPSQVIEAGADGSLLWRGRVSGLLEIRSWILGWGAAAEVLEPAELRAWVAEQHAAAALRQLHDYRWPDPSPIHSALTAAILEGAWRPRRAWSGVRRVSCRPYSRGPWSA